MPKLSFFQLAKIFTAGFLGYALLVSLLSWCTVVYYPLFIKGNPLDMSVHAFLSIVFYYFFVFGFVIAALMLVGAWCVLRILSRKGDSKDQQNAEGCGMKAAEGHRTPQCAAQKQNTW